MKNLLKKYFTSILLFYMPFFSQAQFISNYAKASTACMNFPSLNDTLGNSTIISNYCKPKIKENITALHFGLNKYNITPRIKITLDSFIVILEKDTGTVLEISGYSDSRASDKYNLELSQKRSLSIANYLMTKGIPAKRTVVKNFGEMALLNNCDDNVICTDKMQQENRRVELRIIYPEFYTQGANESTFPNTTYSVKLIDKKIDPSEVGVRINGIKSIFLKYNAEGSYTYYSGIFSQRADAQKHQKELLKKGLKGSVVAFRNEGHVVSR